MNDILKDIIDKYVPEEYRNDIIFYDDVSEINTTEMKRKFGIKNYITIGYKDLIVETLDIKSQFAETFHYLDRNVQYTYRTRSGYSLYTVAQFMSDGSLTIQNCKVDKLIDTHSYIFERIFDHYTKLRMMQDDSEFINKLRNNFVSRIVTFANDEADTLTSLRNFYSSIENKFPTHELNNFAIFNKTSSFKDHLIKMINNQSTIRADSIAEGISIGLTINSTMCKLGYTLDRNGFFVKDVEIVPEYFIRDSITYKIIDYRDSKEAYITKLKFKIVNGNPVMYAIGQHPNVSSDDNNVCLGDNLETWREIKGNLTEYALTQFINSIENSLNYMNLDSAYEDFSIRSRAKFESCDIVFKEKNNKLIGLRDL